MLRQIAGAVAGYVVMAVFIVITFAVAMPVLGIDRLFEPGTYEASTFWIGVSLVLGFTGALLGGLVAAKVGQAPRSAHILAAFVLIFGLASAVAAMSDPARGVPRGPDASLSDIAEHVRQPLWVALLNPLVGVAGVLLGGRGRSR